MTMSTNSSGEFKYNCGFDHQHMTPCTGHTLEIKEHNTSDTVSLVIDGEIELCIDDGGWNALQNAIDYLRLTHQGKWQEANKLREQANTTGRIWKDREQHA